MCYKEERAEYHKLVLLCSLVERNVDECLKLNANFQAVKQIEWVTRYLQQKCELYEVLVVC